MSYINQISFCHYVALLRRKQVNRNNNAISSSFVVSYILASLFQVQNTNLDSVANLECISIGIVEDFFWFIHVFYFMFLHKGPYLTCVEQGIVVDLSVWYLILSPWCWLIWLINHSTVEWVSNAFLLKLKKKNPAPCVYHSNFLFWVNSSCVSHFRDKKASTALLSYSLQKYLVTVIKLGERDFVTVTKTVFCLRNHWTPDGLDMNLHQTNQT